MLELPQEKSQLISFIGHLPGPATVVMARAFQLASQNPLPAHPLWLAASASLDSLYKTLTRQIRPNHAELSAPAPAPYAVGFSGGKDSTAAAIRILKAGGEPRLFYVKGVNKSYPEEEDAAQRVASALRVGLVKRWVQVIGSSDYVENPVKNQLILAMMVDTFPHVNNFAMGNLLCDSTEEYDISCGYSNCQEMFDAAMPVMHFSNHKAKYSHLLENDTESLRTIVDFDVSLLNDVQSCMTPIRYREKLRTDNQKKYNIRLFKNRCGSCYKCAIEWLHLMLWGLNNENELFVNHLCQIMIRGLSRTFGRPVDVREAVENYFFGNERTQLKRLVDV